MKGKPYLLVHPVRERAQPVLDAALEHQEEDHEDEQHDAHRHRPCYKLSYVRGFGFPHAVRVS